MSAAVTSICVVSRISDLRLAMQQHKDPLLILHTDGLLPRESRCRVVGCLEDGRWQNPLHKVCCAW